MCGSRHLLHVRRVRRRSKMRAISAAVVGVPCHGPVGRALGRAAAARGQPRAQRRPDLRRVVGDGRAAVVRPRAAVHMRELPLHHACVQGPAFSKALPDLRVNIIIRMSRLNAPLLL